MLNHLMPENSLLLLYMLVFLLLPVLLFFINQRYRAQRLMDFNQQLQQANAKFETLFEDTTDAILLIKNGKYIDVNTAALKLFGYADKGSFINAKAGTLAPKSQEDGTSSREKILSFLDQCIDKGSVQFEWQSRRVNSEIVWIEVIMTRITLMDETVVHLVARDIDEKKKMQVEIVERTLELEKTNNKLTEQKLIFESLFFDSSDGVSLFRNGQFIDCNRSLLEMLGYYSKEQFLSLALGKLFPQTQPNGESSKKAAVQHLKRCILSGSQRLEWQFLHRSGEPIWFELVITKICSTNKNYIHIVWRNIAENKQLKQQNVLNNKQLLATNKELQLSLNRLKQAQEKLVATEKMASLGGLVAGVAHEINTPIGIGLTGSSKFAEITANIYRQLNNQQLTERALKKYLVQAQDISELMVVNLKRGAELVSSFKQIAVDQTSEEMRSFIVKNYMQEILASLSSVTRYQNIVIELDCDDNVEVNSYPGAISQIFTNLIMNSIKHGFKEQLTGSIKIEIRKVDDYLLVKYKDSGRGIPKQNLSKIFDPFFTTNRDEGGSGLGLNIIYNIITNTFKGSIECRSEEQQGTTFRFNLCIAKVPESLSNERSLHI